MKKRIFVVDDNELILRFVSLHLSEAGYEVHTSSNPLTVAIKVGSIRPDLVLLDVEMPTIRGTEVLGALRRASCHADVKIVFFSSLAPEILEQLRAQCDATAWIRKASPIDGPALIARVGELLSADASPARPKAIVADDSRAMRRILTGAVTQCGFEVLPARDGFELDDLLEVPGDVDLILLDLNMPHTDAVEVVRRVRSLPSGQAPKVLVVSCESDRNLIDGICAAGATAVLRKPFTYTRLVDAVTRLTQGVQRAVS